MQQRVFGLETEYGCLVRDNSLGPPEAVVETVKDYVFYEKQLGLIDLHARNYAFEPARSGGFLLNGGRLYVDAVGDHQEYATPECVNFFDLVAYDKAGQRILQDTINEIGLQDSVGFYNNSVDHFGGHTFGCHENYLVNLEDYQGRRALAYLLPFLVTRQIFAGAGRVGGHRLNSRDFRNNVMEVGDHEVDYIWVYDIYGVEIDKTVQYQLSQRADHILHAVSSRVRFNRAIINPKRDSYYDFSNFTRLHILFGEANMSEYATALKIGTTCLALTLLEMRCLPDAVLITDPVRALKGISRDPRWKWPVRRADGTGIGAVDLQRIYLEYAQRYLRGKDFQTDWILREWEATLDQLEQDPMQLANRLDWVAKLELLRTYMEAEGADWQAEVLHSLDLEYHNVNPEKGLYYALQDSAAVERVCSDEAIRQAGHTPPANTRAWGRSQVIKELMAKRHRRYAIDWDAVYVDKDARLYLRDPLHTYEEEAVRFSREL